MIKKSDDIVSPADLGDYGLRKPLNNAIRNAVTYGAADDRAIPTA